MFIYLLVFVYFRLRKLTLKNKKVIKMSEYTINNIKGTEEDISLLLFDLLKEQNK